MKKGILVVLALGCVLAGAVETADQRRLAEIDSQLKSGKPLEALRQLQAFEEELQDRADYYWSHLPNGGDVDAEGKVYKQMLDAVEDLRKRYAPVSHYIRAIQPFTEAPVEAVRMALRAEDSSLMQSLNGGLIGLYLKDKLEQLVNGEAICQRVKQCTADAGATEHRKRIQLDGMFDHGK